MPIGEHFPTASCENYNNWQEIKVIAFNGRALMIASIKVQFA